MRFKNRNTKYHEAIDKIHNAVDKHFQEHLDQWRALLRQKSVSAYREGIYETAGILRGFTEDIGGTVYCEGDPDFPIVYGRLDRGRPGNLIIYGMYDVQPAEFLKICRDVSLQYG